MLTRSTACHLLSGLFLLALSAPMVPGVSREFILGHVRIGKEKVIEEITAAGIHSR